MAVTRPLPAREGDVIAGKYQIARVLGAGAMGVVVAAEHVVLGRLVALKFLHTDACELDQAVTRFLREGQVLARITSPHVAQVLDVGRLPNGTPYLVMEYLEGSDFGALLKARGPLPVAEAVGYIMQVCEGLAEVHANGIVHRDLKPSNLFLAAGNDGEPIVKVLDFGISKSIASRGLEAASCDNTSTGALVGSPQYMSPEQIRNAKRVDLRTDIWALGVILHELLANSLPFRGESLAGILAAIAADQPIPIRAIRPEVSADLEAVILRSLAKDRNQRYGSIAEFARALKPFAVGEARRSVSRIERVWSRATPMFAADSGASNQSDTISASLPPWEDHARRRPSLLVHWPRRAGVAGVLLVCGAVFWALSARQAVTPRSTAPSSPLAAPPVTEAVTLASVLPPVALDAGAAKPVLTISTGVPGVLAVPSPVRYPTNKAANDAKPKKRLPQAPALGSDEEGTADRK